MMNTVQSVLNEEMREVQDITISAYNFNPNSNPIITQLSNVTDLRCDRLTTLTTLPKLLTDLAFWTGTLKFISVQILGFVIEFSTLAQ